MVVSARTGRGIDELRSRIEARLPRPEVEVHALMPYDRGDLVDRSISPASSACMEHTEHGTLITARVHPTWPASWKGTLSQVTTAGTRSFARRCRDER